METNWLIFRVLTVLVLGYFIGNINFAKIISKFKKDDITKHGSGNPGAMNMARTFGLLTGLLTFVLEGIKGAGAAIAGYFILGIDGLPILGLFIAGAAAVIGQVYPVLDNFKGGKGVATAGGFFFAATCFCGCWWMGLVAFVTAYIILCIVDYGALAAIYFLTVMVAYLATICYVDITVMVLLFLAYLLVIWRHRENIARMFKGTERKMQFAKRNLRMFNKNIKLDESSNKTEQQVKQEKQK